MAKKARGPRSEAETKRLAQALRINLLKRKSLAKIKKIVEKPRKSTDNQ
jgi:hypothetical protein